MRKNKLNLVFHNIVDNERLLSNRYDYAYSFAIGLIENTISTLRDKNTNTVVFLDDGYKSQYKFALEIKNKFDIDVYIPLISNNIGMPGYLSLNDISDLQIAGIKFSSHGVSHAALGKYENGNVLDVPSGGIYRNSPRGHEILLKEEEIKFQVIESAHRLNSLNIKFDSFLYSYGIYNDSIKKIIKDSSIYKKAFSCDEALECENSDLLALPRVLVYSDVSIKNFIFKIRNIVERD